MQEDFSIFEAITFANMNVIPFMATHYHLINLPLWQIEAPFFNKIGAFMFWTWKSMILTSLRLYFGGWGLINSLLESNERIEQHKESGICFMIIALILVNIPVTMWRIWVFWLTSLQKNHELKHWNSWHGVAPRPTWLPSQVNLS